MRTELQKIAAVCGVPYHQFTGDYSGINFSTLRGICVELRTRIEYTYHFYLIPLAILPVAYKFRQFVALKSPELATTIPNFQLPRFYGVDELKDAQADVFEIQNGISTLKKVLEERHLTYEEIEEDRKRIREMGLDSLLVSPGSANAQTNNNSANSNSTGNA
jgi:capsid protein